MTLSRRIIAEVLGTAFLLATVVGSAIMGERLAGGNTAIALLANTLATGATLATLIFCIRADLRRPLPPSLRAGLAGAMSRDTSPARCSAHLSASVWRI